MLKMLTDYMEGGYLENIISLFRKDKTLYPLIGDMIGDDRGRVRLGTIALVENLIDEQGESVFSAIPAIAAQLKHTNPTVRGDAAHLLGIIGHRDALPFLQQASGDQHVLVRESVQEAIQTIQNNTPQ